MYTPTLGSLRYSSLIVGQWDTLTQAGGDNVRLFGSFKTRNGVLVVGMHTGAGNQIPVANVPTWGASAYAGESGVLAYFRADELVNPDDDPTDPTTGITNVNYSAHALAPYPNPARDRAQVLLPNASPGQLELLDVSGRVLRTMPVNKSSIAVDVATLQVGTYLVRWRSAAGSIAVARLMKE